MSHSDPWEEAKKKYAVGQWIEGKVVHIDVFGVFVELPDGTIGLVEAPEIPGGKSLTLDEFPKIGTTVRAKVLWYRDHNNQLILSMRGP